MNGVVLNYDKLVGGYWEGLNTQLRKFGTGYEFLELWVPDDDPTVSISNMVEAAGSYGLGSFSIGITSGEVARSLDVGRLKKSLGDAVLVSTREKEDGGVVLDIGFKREYAIGALELDDIPAFYRLKFNFNREAADHERALALKSPLVFIEAEHAGIKLRANVDSKIHTVMEAAFAGPTTAVSKRLMNELCDFLIRKPINECHDHSVIQLEYHLREDPKKRPNAGITLPFNSWEIFRALTVLVRKLAAQYRLQTNCKDQNNFYDLPASAEWAAASPAGQINLIQKAIDNFTKERDIAPSSVIVKNVLRGAKVVLEAAPEVCRHDSVLLLDLEVYLRRNVEKTLSLYNEEEPDKNKMRWDRPAVKSQAAVSKLILEDKVIFGEG